MPFASLLQVATTIAKPLFAWRDVGTEYLGFLANFSLLGALGFHFLVLGRLRGQSGPGKAPVDEVRALVYANADHIAAAVGIAGSCLLLLNLLATLAKSAAKAQASMPAAFAQLRGVDAAQYVFAVVLIVVFALARSRQARGAGWIMAGVVGLAFALRDVTQFRWTAMVNPIHVLCGSLWLGTLFSLVVAGLPSALHSGVPREQRARLVADLVSTFSPVALIATGFLGATGLTTAILHLKYVSAIWTTPYGITLDIKLCLVSIVLGMGAWNWRRMTPKLASEEGGHALRRTARTELTFGAIVLAVTAVLVSVPSPRLPGAPHAAKAPQKAP